MEQRQTAPVGVASEDMTVRFASGVLVISCLLVVTACGSAATPGPTPTPNPSLNPTFGASAGPSSAVTVQLGIYSGRPDPAWTLSAAEAATLERLLANLPAIAGTPRVGGLGYHGFTILMPTGWLVAYGGAVAPPGDGRRSMKIDPTRSIERFLLESARPHLAPSELSEATRGLAAP